MTEQFIFSAPIALLPALMFLAVLVHFDSYKLVSIYEVMGTLLAGAFLAGMAWLINSFLIDATQTDFIVYSKYIAPVVEEIIKSSALVYLFVRNRIGFKIDAAIMGFAIGTGFALVENLYYLYIAMDANVGTWIIRGFGTAIMHGGTTALLGVIAQFFVDRYGKMSVLYYLPGLAAAIVFHAVFNYFQYDPLVATFLILVGLPPGFFAVFQKSERGVHTWLLHDYESHEHLLKEIEEGRFKDSEVGQYIARLNENLPAETIADVFLYIRVHTELVIRAEQITLARETKVDIVIGPDDRERFSRMVELEGRIGRTALMTLQPHLHFSRRELWEIHELKSEVKHDHRAPKVIEAQATPVDTQPPPA